MQITAGIFAGLLVLDPTPAARPLSPQELAAIVVGPLDRAPNLAMSTQPPPATLSGALLPAIHTSAINTGQHGVSQASTSIQMLLTLHTSAGDLTLPLSIRQDF